MAKLWELLKRIAIANVQHYEHNDLTPIVFTELLMIKSESCGAA